MTEALFEHCLLQRIEAALQPLVEDGLIQPVRQRIARYQHPDRPLPPHVFIEAVVNQEEYVVTETHGG